jgi:hypothetical protein
LICSLLNRTQKNSLLSEALRMSTCCLNTNIVLVTDVFALWNGYNYLGVMCYAMLRNGLAPSDDRWPFFYEIYNGR